MIPRLSPSSGNFRLDIAINKRLRPYFEKWFNTEKLPGESPDSFVIRKMKHLAIQDYLKSELPAEISAVSLANSGAKAALAADVALLGTEVDG